MFQIKSLSKPVIENLFELNNGYVHSVFNNVVNVKRENMLISIQNNTVPKGSLSMIVDEEVNFKKYTNRLGGKVQIKGSIITIGTMEFLINEPEIWDPELKSFSKMYFSNKEALIKTIKNTILINGKDSGIKDAVLKNLKQNISQSHIEEDILFHRILSEALNSLRNKELNRAAVEISNLIGIGIGLTPSGDDFLVGLISVLYTMKQENSYIKSFYNLLKEEISKKVNKTTDVSRTYLLEAVDGRFSESFHNIYAALDSVNLEELYKSALSMMAVGHSSGTDGLCGILWGFYQLEYLN